MGLNSTEFFLFLIFLDLVAIFFSQGTLVNEIFCIRKEGGKNGVFTEHLEKLMSHLYKKE